MEWALIIAGIVGLVMAAAGKGTQGPGQNEAEAPTPVYEPEGPTPALPEPAHVDFRPKTLKEYIGQEDMKKVIEVEIAAAKINAAPFPHTLLTGPAGLGKTSIANVIANEMGVPFYTITGPAVANPRAFSLLGVEVYNRPGRTWQKLGAYQVDYLNIITKFAKKSCAEREIKVCLNKAYLAFRNGGAFGACLVVSRDPWNN